MRRTLTCTRTRTTWNRYAAMARRFKRKGLLPIIWPAAIHSTDIGDHMQRWRRPLPPRGFRRQRA